MRTATRTNAQLKVTQKSRANVFDFMKRFSARHYWTIDGPRDTDVDEIMCFCMFNALGENMGITLIQTWCSGGWSIFTEPVGSGELDETERAIHRNRASADLMDALQEGLEELQGELEQRQTSGNDESYDALEFVVAAGNAAITKARGGLPPPPAPSDDALSIEETAHVVATGHMPPE